MEINALIVLHGFGEIQDCLAECLAWVTLFGGMTEWQTTQNILKYGIC